jgi:putative hydrolase of the HAD superfamily
MITIFDLDDTLYLENTFVESGFHAVADMLEKKFGWNRQHCFDSMITTLKFKGRGAVFDELLRSHDAYTQKQVKYCVQVYRKHGPKISLFAAAKYFLEENRGRKMYLVTDGNKCVQANKVKALQLGDYFKKIFITHRYGLLKAKPSIYCFDLIRNIEGCKWSEMAYIGDNPTKDFVNLNSKGVFTVRVLTGENANVLAKPGFDGKVTIESLKNLKSILSY